MTSATRLPAPGRPDRYDDPAAEYAAAREGVALLDLRERGLLVATGPRRQEFLNGILSNELLRRPAGQGCLAALMDVKGHLQALMRALVTADSVVLEMAADRLAPVEATLHHYRVAAPVRLARPAAAVLGLVGPQAAALLASLGADVAGLAPEAHLASSLPGGEVRVARASDLPDGFVLHALPEAAGLLWPALVEAGAQPLGRQALDALRVEQGLPWYGRDVSAENLLHETGLLALYHSPSKGCYLGQEVVARLEARGGNVSHALRGLRLEAPVTDGAELRVGQAAVGRVTTAGVSPRLGPVALAYVHRNHFAPGTRVDVAGVAATVASLPLAG